MTAISQIEADIITRTVGLRMPSNGTENGVQTIVDTDLFALLLFDEESFKCYWFNPHSGMYMATFYTNDRTDEELTEFVISCAQRAGLSGMATDRVVRPLGDSQMIDFPADDDVFPHGMDGDIGEYDSNPQANIDIAGMLPVIIHEVDDSMLDRVKIRADLTGVTILCVSERDRAIMHRIVARVAGKYFAS
jgi:hypothetical protein